MLTKKMMNQILVWVGLLIAVCGWGLLANGKTAVAQTDQAETADTYMFSDKIYFEADDAPSNRIFIQSVGEKLPSSYVDGGISHNDYLAALSTSFIRKGTNYTMYDVINTYFDYANGVIGQDDAMTKLNKIFADTSSVDSVADLDDVKDECIAPFPNSSVDMERTREKAKKTVTPEKVADQDYDYSLPDFTVYIAKNNYTMTIKYVLPDGTAAHKDAVVHGYKGKASTTITSPTVDNYVPDQRAIRVNFDNDNDDNTITVHYTMSSNTATTATNQSSLTANDSATITVDQKISASIFNAKATDSNGQSIPVTVDTGKANLAQPGTYQVVLKAANGQSKTVTLIVKSAEPATVAPKKSVVYGLKKLYLYQKPTFTKHQRIASYVKTKRTKRPMFVVTGYARSKAGLLRYQVKDVNHTSATAGETGYITARNDFVIPVYYQKSVKQVEVLNKHGVNLYRNVNLTKRTEHVKQGQTVKVVALKKHNLTTRFVTSDGQYLTANKKLVMVVK